MVIEEAALPAGNAEPVAAAVEAPEAALTALATPLPLAAVECPASVVGICPLAEEAEVMLVLCVALLAAIDEEVTAAWHAETAPEALLPPTKASFENASKPVLSSTWKKKPAPEVRVIHQVTFVAVTLVKVAMGSSLVSLQSVKT